MLKKTPLASAISSISVASVIAAGGAAIPAFAADEMLEEVVVTGSRIKRADLDSASPITVLQRDDLVLSGMTDVGDLLQSMPSMSGSPIGTTTNNGGNGSVQIDLRGMGPTRTLTLVNGQRMVDAGDFQTIPATMIERVEILKDGASATYGADAVAGVVNIITRTDFEGVEVFAQSADWTDSAGEQNTTGLIAGKTFDGGHFVFGAEFVNQHEAYQRDVPWDYMQNSYYIYPEGCENQVAAPYDGSASGGCYPIGSSRIPESRLSFLDVTSLYANPDVNAPPNSGGRFEPTPAQIAANQLGSLRPVYLIGTAASAPYEVGSIIAHDGRTYNYAPVNYLQTPYERTNLFAEGRFEVVDDVYFRTEIRGNTRTSAQELAPLPFTGGDPMYDGNFMGIPYTGVSEDNYYLRRAIDAHNAANPGANFEYIPLDQPRRRMIETNRRFTQEVQQYQFLAELSGTINDIDWQVFYNEGYRNRIDNDFGQFSGVRLFNALGPSADLDANGQPECYTDITDPSTLIVGCVPLNLFGGGVVDAGGSVVTSTLTADMINYVSLDTVDTFTSRQRIFGATVSGGGVDLPGGELGWAAGYSHWNNSFNYTPDSAKTIGAVTGNVGAGTDGSLTNDSVFGEVLAPVFDNGEQSVLLKGGLRWDDWDAFDGDTTWQVGVEFNVVQDFKLRATGGTIFRAPTVGALYGGLVDTFPTYSDPCIPPAGQALPAGCAQTGVQLDSQLHALVGGNPNLQPETGDTVTAGMVWTPTFGDHGVSLTVDYWKIDLEDGISSLGAQFILDDCYLAGNAQSCALITRKADFSIDTVLDGSLNVATQGAAGIDTEFRWTYASDMGQWQASFLWSHMLDRTKTAFPGSAEEDLAGRYTDPTAQDGGAYAENKINYSVRWMWNDLTVGYLGEFISALDADTFCNCGAGNQPDGSYIQSIDSFLYHDLVFSYDAPYGVTLSGGITNLTDEAPPYIEVGFNATTDPSTYRLFGRGYYLRAGWKY